MMIFRSLPFRGISSEPFPCFDIAFEQLVVISKTRTKFVEITAVKGRYLIITHVKNEESKMESFRICEDCQ